MPPVLLHSPQDGGPIGGASEHVIAAIDKEQDVNPPSRRRSRATTSRVASRRGPHEIYRSRRRRHARRHHQRMSLRFRSITCAASCTRSNIGSKSASRVPSFPAVFFSHRAAAGLSPVALPSAAGHSATPNRFLHGSPSRGASTSRHDNTRTVAGPCVRCRARKNASALCSGQPGCCVLTDRSRKYTSWLLGGMNDANSLSSARQLFFVSDWSGEEVRERG